MRGLFRWLDVRVDLDESTEHMGQSSWEEYRAMPENNISIVNN